MTLVTIDPGIRTGVAVFKNSRLKHCGLLKYDDPQVFVYTLISLFDLLKPDILVIEMPRVYARKFWKGDPNDLILVAKIAGIAIGLCNCVFEEIFVQDWKGQRPKDVDNEYTKNLLNKEEVKVLQSEKIPKSYIHNTLDAIGIGLWKLGRR